MTAAEAAALVTWPVLRRPTVATRHFANDRGSTLRGRAAAPLIDRMLVAQLSISRYVAQSTASRTEVVLSGVPNAPAVDPVAQVVLVAQRLEPEKQTRDALLAWRQSALAEQGWQLWIAGDGSERNSLEALVSHSRVDGVCFLGERDAARLHAQAGIFLATTPSDGFGLSVAEAMAAGLPVVAARGGGHLETVGGADPDLLYSPGETQQCASLLRGLAADVDRRRSVGRKLRTFQQRVLSLAAHVDRLEQIYFEHSRLRHG
jgi:glycosyltransferase involved in cell wall biosynthesis